MFRSRNLSFILLGVLAFLWVPFDAIDSSRYYLAIDTTDANISLNNFILNYYLIGFDFIYYLLFYLCIKLNLPLQIVTGLSVGLLFYNSFIFIDNVKSKYCLQPQKKDEYLLKIFVLFSVSFVTVFGISRNVTALMFLAFGLNKLLNEKYLLSIIFFIIAIFTHIGLIIYLTIFLFGYYWKGKFINSITIRRILLVIATIIGFKSIFWLSHIFSPLNDLSFFKVFSYYSKYLNAEEATNIFLFGIGKWDILMLLTSAITLFYALFFIKKYNPIIWVCFIAYIWLVFSMGFSQMFTQRTVLFLIILQGCLAISFFGEHRKSLITSIYRGLLYLSILAFFLNVYSYRDIWVFRLP